MGIQNATSSPAPSKNHIDGHHHEVIPSSSLLVVVILVIIVILLLAILLLTVMLRRLQFSRANTAASTTRRIIADTDCMFIARSTMNIAPTSDRGCLYGNSSAGGTPPPKGREVQVQVQVFTLNEAEMATNKFSEANVIGNGASGAVFRGVLRDGTVAAIKMLRPHGRYAERAFRQEVDLLSRLRSPFIAELLGYCADQNHRLLVFEYMPNGSLHKHLHQRKTLNWGARLKIALDCAKALEYLHEHNTPSIIHRNFKSTNILLDKKLRPKLSGFGLAKIGSEKLNGQISTRVLGTTGYLAPEYASTGKLTTKSDVYSYGVILLELLTGRVPIDTTRPPGEHVLVSWALPHLTNRDKVVEMIDPILQGQYSNKDLIQVAAIAAMCVQAEADYRPLITDVVQSLMPLIKNPTTNLSSNSLRFSRSPIPRS
ncbi:Serine/threonine protein kinase [Handroanthus impetiginosus]|uniref:Serine/threonine protein kinase n=1 Tax=Handroanthus impetiginosus TaxID=429701 RepID=A0A2G9IAN8_9LAMI|nr:Serine/threonine protein kinase [Handroanthus impetiginosus]